MEGLELLQVGWLSILPPVLAIALALITKEVYSSLLVGVASGMVIYSCAAGTGVLEGLFLVPRMMAEQISGNGFMILFLALLGALVAVVTLAGGSRAYGEWASRKIRSAVGAKLCTAVLGVLIFIDDYFNCLTVGTVMGPVTDKFKVSREKLAYFIDATAAPVCIISPISSWAVAVAGQIGSEADGFTIFLQAIPYNLYALLTLLMVFFLCVTRFDFGPMRQAEREAQANGCQETEAQDEIQGIQASSRGTVLDLVLPILVLIVCSVLGMAYVGGFFDGGVDFIAAIGENPTFGLSLGAFAALITAFLLYLPRKLVRFRDFMDGCVSGVKSMVPAVMILTFAWSLSGTCRSMLGTGEFVSDVVSRSGVPLAILPAFVFLVAAFLSFSTGTAWGTFGILLPIVIPICSGEAGAPYLVASIGATLAGSVYGDHCSPISDTTILSSTGARCNHLRHVSTQLPYATFVAALCFVGYLLTGLLKSPWIPLAASALLMFACFWFLYLREKKKAPEER